MPSVAVFSPAKINLFLAVTGRRPDGFHDLVSLVSPLGWGDSVWIEAFDAEGPVSLACSDPAVPAGPENLAVRAAEAFRDATGCRAALAIDLVKRIPMGAGLGGGSSNAAAVLRGLDVLFGHPLSRERLLELGASLGSDVPLFIENAPCVMRGRGERIEPLAPALRARLSGRAVVVFKPDFPIATPWAYGQLAAAAPGSYLPPEEAEARLDAVLGPGAGGGIGPGLFNSFEPVVFRKYLALPVLVDAMRVLPGVDGVLLSGSGSACFALMAPGARTDAVHELLREALGDVHFAVETALG